MEYSCSCLRAPLVKESVCVCLRLFGLLGRQVGQVALSLRVLQQQEQELRSNFQC
jgi:hypothetical protein